MNLKQIDIAKDFSPFPAGRYEDDGPYTGEHFREQILMPALQSNEKVVVNLEGARGYGSSFLEEAFGGLVRNGYFTKDQLHHCLEIKAGIPAYDSYVQEIWEYIDLAETQVPV